MKCQVNIYIEKLTNNIKSLFSIWCPRTDSNRGPIDYKSIALPAELQGRIMFCIMILRIIKVIFSVVLYGEKQ